MDYLETKGGKFLKAEDEMEVEEGKEKKEGSRKSMAESKGCESKRAVKSGGWKKTGEVLAREFLLCHWKSELWGRTLFDLVFLF